MAAVGRHKPVLTGEVAAGNRNRRPGFLAPARKSAKNRHGERPDRRRWRRKGGERVAAVGKTQACFDRRSGCRVPQQDNAELIAPAIKVALPVTPPDAHRRGYGFSLLRFMQCAAPGGSCISHILRKREDFCVVQKSFTEKRLDFLRRLRYTGLALGGKEC